MVDFVVLFNDMCYVRSQFLMGVVWHCFVVLKLWSTYFLRALHFLTMFYKHLILFMTDVKIVLYLVDNFMSLLEPEVDDPAHIYKVVDVRYNAYDLQSS